VANTDVTWPGRLRQIRAFFRNRSPGQLIAPGSAAHAEAPAPATQVS
jgi:hypothetical protein